MSAAAWAAVAAEMFCLNCYLQKRASLQHMLTAFWSSRPQLQASRKLMIVPVSCSKDNSHITPGSCPRLQACAVQQWLQKCVWLCDSNGYGRVWLWDSNGYGRVWLWDSIPYRLVSHYETPVRADLPMTETSVNTDLFWSARHQ